jgi:hypothetical protein
MKITFLVIKADGKFVACQSNDCSQYQRKHALHEYGCNLAAAKKADELNAKKQIIR